MLKLFKKYKSTIVKSLLALATAWYIGVPTVKFISKTAQHYHVNENEARIVLVAKNDAANQVKEAAKFFKQGKMDSVNAKLKQADETIKATEKINPNLREDRHELYDLTRVFYHYDQMVREFEKVKEDFNLKSAKDHGILDGYRYGAVIADKSWSSLGEYYNQYHQAESYNEYDLKEVQQLNEKVNDYVIKTCKDLVKHVEKKIENFKPSDNVEKTKESLDNLYAIQFNTLDAINYLKKLVPNDTWTKIKHLEKKSLKHEVKYLKHAITTYQKMLDEGVGDAEVNSFMIKALQEDLSKVESKIKAL